MIKIPFFRGSIKKVSVAEFRKNLKKYTEYVEKGQNRKVYLTRRGKVVAIITNSEK